MVDWIVGRTSNVSVANHRDWFETYTPFRTTVKTPKDAILEVHGIGNVCLEVRARDNVNAQTYHTLQLTDVLHAPCSITNVMRTQPMNNINHIAYGERGWIRFKSGKEMLLARPGVQKLWLVGQAWSHTSLQREEEHLVGAEWSASERARWQAYQRSPSPDVGGVFMGGVVFAMQGHDAPDVVRVRSPVEAQKIDNIRSVPKKQTSKHWNQGLEYNDNGFRYDEDLTQEPSQEKRSAQHPKQNQQPQTTSTQRAATAETSFGYTPAEKAWLKRNWGNEFKFLRAYGLKIQRRQDKVEGRQLVRGFMEDDRVKQGAAAYEQGPQMKTLAGLGIGPGMHGARFR